MIKSWRLALMAPTDETTFSLATANPICRGAIPKMPSTKMDSDVSHIDVKPTRHILGLSGGKDSAALAIYLKDQGRDDRIEYFFCDTGAELREVYEYLDRLEDYLARPIETP